MLTTSRKPAVLITGASRGLGAVMTERLAAEGYVVFAAARRPNAFVDADVIPITLDVTSATSIAGAVAAVEAHLHGAALHALVNNAAVLHAGPVETSSPERIQAQLLTNIAGPLMTTQAFLPILRRSHGRIVNVGSINAQLPMPNWAVYSASKAALVALSDALRMELCAWNIGVTVLTLGAFATDIRRHAQEAWSSHVDSHYEEARLANARLVAYLDSAADDPGLVADALVDVLRADPVPAHRAVGTGIDDLLALAAQPADERAAALQQLLAGSEHSAAVDGSPACC